MKKILRSSLAIAIGLSLAACHDHKESTPPQEPSTLEFSGAAIKGALHNATVNVYDANDLTKVLATAQTGTDGTYTAEISDTTGAAINGAFVVSISADEDTTMVCDATECNGAVDGIVPASELAGLELSTFTFTDGVAPVAADVNTLTTMATDVLKAAVAANEAIDLTNLTQDVVTTLQQDASQVVGALLGVDLSATNIYDVKIVDASVSADVATDNAIAATLTLMNASLAGLDIAADETIASAISEYVGAIEAVATAVFAAEDPTTVDLGAVASEALEVINNTQAQTAVEIEALAFEIGQDIGEDLVVEEIPAEIDPEEVGDTIGEVIIGTGGTGGTGG